MKTLSVFVVTSSKIFSPRTLELARVYQKKISPILVLVAATCAVIIPSQAIAQQALAIADAETKNGGTRLTVFGMIKPTAKGLSVAGEKVFTPVAEGYAISDKLQASRAPTATELPKMKDLIPFVQMLAQPNLNAAQVTAFAKAFAAVAEAEFLPVMGDFTRINKGQQKLDSGQVSDNNNPNPQPAAGSENTFAQAKQDAVTNPNQLSTKGTNASAIARAGTVIKNPMAAAYAVNLDPFVVQWDSSSNRSVTLELTGLEFLASTAGANSAAAVTMNLVGRFIDGTDNVDLPPDGSSSLFTLSLGSYDFDASAPIPVVDLTYRGFTTDPSQGNLTISDSAGGTGLNQVAADLAQRFILLSNGDFGITGTYSITMSVPGSAPTSLLFLNDIEGAAAQSSVPEPSSFWLMSFGVSLLLIFYRGVNRVASN